MKSAKLRFPKVLADELLDAFAAVNAVIPRDQTLKWLEAFRQVREANIDLFAQTGWRWSGLIPYEYLEPLMRLELAFARLHRYKAGGTSDYISRGVVLAVYRELREQGKKRTPTHSATSIVAYLDARNYQNLGHGQCKGVVSDAAAHFKCSATTIKKAIPSAWKRTRTRE